MAENGVRSADLPQAAVVDEVIGNRDSSTINIKVDNLAQQMLGSGPIATEMAVLSSQITSGRVSQPTWATLVLITPPDDGTGGEVLESDEGSHTDPVTTLVVNNSGTYAWRAATPGWERIGDIGLAGKLNKAANLGDVEDPVAARENLEVTSSGEMNALLDGKADREHGHGIGNVAGLQPALDGKSDSGHGHDIGNVAGLQPALDGKADSGHGHSIGNVVGLQQTLDGQLKSSGNLGDVADSATARANLGVASATQGAKADSALQADDVADVATSGLSDDLVEGQSVQLMTVSEREKIGRLSVLAPLDLDALAAKVDGLDQAVVLKGAWDASGGGFPGDGLAQVGWTYIATAAGVVDGVTFSINDRVISLAANASTTTYAGNWIKVDYTDQVLSVAGKSGAVSLVKDDVGLGSVDNTPDAAKPVSAAQQIALDGKASVADLSGHAGNSTNPHAVGKAQVGLGAVDDTADADKPVSVAHVGAETNQRGFHTGENDSYGLEATDASGNVVQRLRMSDGETESLANRRLWSLGAEEDARNAVADTASLPPRLPGAFNNGVPESLTPVLVDENDRAVLALEDGFLVQQARKAFANGADQ
ncbi:MAG: hypothetical protein KUG74_08585, partial [Rhodobacteraceae bacterium]|nr:hypothetical protein [Paracoccaceae bacterium]